MAEKRFAEKRNLKRFLKQRCLSYRKFSKLCGISNDALCRKINGESVFTAVEISDISLYFDLSAEEIGRLFFEEERKKRADELGFVGTSINTSAPF